MERYGGGEYIRSEQSPTPTACGAGLFTGALPVAAVDHLKLIGVNASLDLWELRKFHVDQLLCIRPVANVDDYALRIWEQPMTRLKGRGRPELHPIASFHFPLLLK